MVDFYLERFFMSNINGNSRRQFTAQFKAKVAICACRGDLTVNQIAAQFEIHPNQVSLWKKELLDGAGQIFETPRGRKPSADKLARHEALLYNQIGRLKVENDWLKKKSGLSIGENE